MRTIIATIKILLTIAFTYTIILKIMQKFQTKSKILIFDHDNAKTHKKTTKKHFEQNLTLKLLNKLTITKKI